MGSSSSKKEKVEPPPPKQQLPQNINIQIDLKGLSELFKSINNGSTRLDGSSFSIFGGDAAPMANVQPQNLYSNQTYNMNVPSNSEDINIPISPFKNNNSIKSSPNQNDDNTNYGKDINPNVKVDKNLNQNKETSKGSKYKEEINHNIPKFNGVSGKEEQFTKPSNNDNNMGNGFNPSNYQLFTDTGNNNDNNIERQKDNYNSPGANKDNNNIRDNNHPLDNDDDNNSLTQSVLLASFQNLNFNDPNSLSIIKQTATQKYNEGYFPLFVKMNHRITYYYLKQESTLKNLLYAHLNSLKLPCSEEKYLFYNKGKKLNPNIPINDIDSLSILSIIEIKEKE